MSECRVSGMGTRDKLKSPGNIVFTLSVAIQIRKTLMQGASVQLQKIRCV